jgi:regulator of protease activity HflC (stomatin/prohibitin superfamily)
MGIAGVLLVVAVILGVLAIMPKTPAPARRVSAIGALVVLVMALGFSTTTYVSSDEVGILSKNALGGDLKNGKIIAVDGENGVQADVLPPGWHFWVFPIIHSVKTVPLVEIKSGEVGIIETTDGVPMAQGQLFADEWDPKEVQSMLDARYFLTSGKGRKGKQITVLTPGKYRLNTELYRIKMVPSTEVINGEVAVLTANFGKPASIRVEGFVEPGSTGEARPLMLAGPGEMGIRAEVLGPGKYPLNTDAYSVTEIWTTRVTAHYTAAGSGNPGSTTPSRGGVTNDAGMEEREITVRTSDGFTFPVDVRVSYQIDPRRAPIIVAQFKDDEGGEFRNYLNSTVRAVFRNNGEGVRALDYVQQRSHQEQQSFTMLAAEMSQVGVNITAVQIGNVGDDKTLGALLKTQTDREIAKQELITFQEQQKAADKKKELARVTQEAEEEKKLATAAYSAKIAEEKKKEQITAAMAEAESTKIKALAQAEAYKEIALQIGKSNAALIEVLKIVGERQIQITPRVMIGGGSATPNGQGMGTALIGTMLDTMMSREEERQAEKPIPKAEAK